MLSTPQRKPPQLLKVNVTLSQMNWKAVPEFSDSPDSPLPPTSVDDDADGISDHRLAPYIANYRK